MLTLTELGKMCSRITNLPRPAHQMSTSSGPQPFRTEKYKWTLDLFTSNRPPPYPLQFQLPQITPSPPYSPT